MKKLISFVLAALPWCLLLLLYAIDPAFAQFADGTVDDVSDNIVNASAEMPAMVTAAAYLAGLTLGVQGVIKLKNHVDNPQQTPLRVPAIRFLACGCLLAIQFLWDVAENLITGGEPDTAFDHGDLFSFSDLISGIAGGIASLPLLDDNINGVLGRIAQGLQTAPGLISAAAFLLALGLSFTAILKLKDHVENPDQTPLRESIIRFITAGCFFGFSYFLKIITSTVTGGQGVGVFGTILDILGVVGFIKSGYGKLGMEQLCIDNMGLGAGGTIGSIFCGSVFHTLSSVAFLNAMAYLIGLVLAFWGILKIRDHVLNPQQVKVTEGITRLVSAALFLCLPVAIAAIRTTVTPIGSTAAALVPISFKGGGYNEKGVTPDCLGLDGSLACFMSDLIGPVHIALNFFSFVLGMVLIMIGISRLMKTAQDGPKGPGGMGTLMTFFIGGALISYNEMVRAFTMTFFSQIQTKTYAQISYTKGMTTEEQGHVHVVISAILKFMIIVGLISFVRGLFIVRSVAEGNSQASMMAGVTHLAGGAFAINLGGVINAVQETLGLTKFGVQFF